MATSEIQLTPNNQQFAVVLGGVSYVFRINWRETFWALDILDRNQRLMIGGIPMVTGADLLQQHRYLGFGFELRVGSDDPAQPSPSKENLGYTTHLYAVTN
ncbi:hypothetical protein R84981_002818 [Carnimonas sp. R-84981]|uniref:phage baseplate plug family protein n=1 Tax=Carnimonas bestiolae TaxID=3402172 RepID=UPI003EDC25B3